MPVVHPTIITKSTIVVRGQTYTVWHHGKHGKSLEEVYAEPRNRRPCYLHRGTRTILSENVSASRYIFLPISYYPGLPDIVAADGDISRIGLEWEHINVKIHLPTNEGRGGYNREWIDDMEGAILNTGAKYSTGKHRTWFQLTLAEALEYWLDYNKPEWGHLNSVLVVQENDGSRTIK